MEQRIAWDDLAGPLKQAIEARTGPITGVRIATAGQNSPLAAIIDTRDGKVFVKGLPSDHRRVITQAREAAVAPLVSEISPALLWHFDEAGWNVLGYEYADGRHADYTPGSPDLDRLVQLMDALSAIKVLDDPGPLKRAEDRWKPYLDDPETASVFAGPVLTHSDWTPDNVLVSAHRAWLIDWAWPTLGAGWTDPACWVLRLMASGGHTAHEAERQASRLPAFAAADPAHIDLFAAANVRLWDRDRAVEHQRLDDEDGTSRAVMVRLPPGSLSPPVDAPGAATPARLPTSRHAGGSSQRVPSGQADPPPAHQLAFRAAS